MDNVVQDVRFAIRTLLKQPLFTFVAVATLALGIGANTAIFSVVNNLLLRPLPFPDSDRVGVLWETTADRRTLSVSPPNFEDWAVRQRSFDALAFSVFWGVRTVLGRGPTRGTVEYVSDRFFDVFRVQPIVGRTLHESDFGLQETAVVGQRFWLRYLGADSNLTDVHIDVNGENYQVVGVLPASFRYQEDSDIWLPGRTRQWSNSRTSHFMHVAGRLRAGVTFDDARSDMNRVAQEVVREAGADNDAIGVHIDRMQDLLVGDTTRPLLLLAGGAGLLLLLGCTNVASTLLARGAARQRELAIRTAVGAGRARLLRQLMTESVVLAVCGVGVGLTFALLTLTTLTRIAPASLLRTRDVTLDGASVGFALLAGSVTALLFGLLPGLRLSQLAPGVVLRAGAPFQGGGPRGQVWRVLVAFQVAAALVLSIGTGLLVRSFGQTMSADPGFDATHALTVQFSLPEARYPDPDRVATFHDRLLADLARQPGVRSVGIINHLPLSGQSMFAGIEFTDRADRGRGDYRMASSKYFEAMGIPIVEGRSFEASDRPGHEHVILVNEALAREYWPNRSPIGQRVRLTGNDRFSETWLTVVGVVGDIRHRSLTATDRPTYYVHYRQRPMQARTVTAVLRTDADPESLVRSVQARFRTLDPDVPTVFATMRDIVNESVADPRFTMLLLVAFAATALLLTAVGIYGVVSYTVSRQTREIGIRLALGANPGRVRAMVVWESMRTVLLGGAVGIGVAFATNRALSGLLYEVSPNDGVTISLATGLVAVTALIASVVPASRATQIDPLRSVRAE
jgi:putative ABC transport system permease protein